MTDGVRDDLLRASKQRARAGRITDLEAVLDLDDDRRRLQLAREPLESGTDVEVDLGAPRADDRADISEHAAPGSLRLNDGIVRGPFRLMARELELDIQRDE